MGRVFQRKRANRPGSKAAGTKLPGWYAHWRDEQGRQHLRKVGATQREAKAFLAQVEAEVQKRRLRPGWQVDCDGSTTLGAFVDEYLAKMVTGRLKAEADRHHHLAAWRVFFGDGLPLREISPGGVQGYLASLRDSGRSPATCNRHLASLRHALNTALKWGHLSASPLVHVKPLPEDNERTRVISADEEVRLLAAAADSRNKALRPLIIIALETCARPEELLGLRWNDVDLERRLVTFTKTKAKRTRHVPLTRRAIDALEQLGTRFAGEWVFTYRGGQWKDQRAAFRSACKTAGIRYGLAVEGGLVFRDTRRTAITRLAERGVPASTIQRWSGHSTLSMVQRYVAVSDEAVRAVADALDWERDQSAITSPKEPPASSS